ncbi:hypothetical protein GCM10010376_01810 [Streptomyces violaceusniger]
MEAIPHSRTAAPPPGATLSQTGRGVFSQQHSDASELGIPLTGARRAFHAGDLADKRRRAVPIWDYELPDKPWDPAEST